MSINSNLKTYQNIGKLNEKDYSKALSFLKKEIKEFGDDPALADASSNITNYIELRQRRFFKPPEQTMNEARKKANAGLQVINTKMNEKFAQGVIPAHPRQQATFPKDKPITIPTSQQNKLNSISILKQGINNYNITASAFFDKKARLDDAILSALRAKENHEKAPNLQTKSTFEKSKTRLGNALSMAVESARSVAVTSNGILSALNTLKMQNQLRGITQNPYLTNAIKTCQNLYIRINKLANAASTPNHDKTQILNKLSQSMQATNAAQYLLSTASKANKNSHDSELILLDNNNPKLKKAVDNFEEMQNRLSSFVNQAAGTLIGSTSSNEIPEISTMIEAHRSALDALQQALKEAQNHTADDLPNTQPISPFDKLTTEMLDLNEDLKTAENIIGELPRSLKLQDYLELAHGQCIEKFSNLNPNNRNKLPEIEYYSNRRMLKNLLSAYNEIGNISDGNISEILNQTDSALQKLNQSGRDKYTQGLIESLSQTRSKFIYICDQAADSIIMQQNNRGTLLDESKNVLQELSNILKNEYEAWNLLRMFS